MPTNPRGKKKAESSSPKPLDESLQRFLESFEQLPVQMATAMLEQITDEDERQVAESLSSTLSAQVRELCTFVRENAVMLSAQGKVEVSRIMRISAGSSLVRSGQTLASNLTAPSHRIGLSGIFELIKKIIKALLDIFGISLPRWLDKLLDLIDEIVNQLLSIGSPQLGHTLSLKHQDYLGEMVQLERLQRECAWRFQTEESEA